MASCHKYIEIFEKSLKIFENWKNEIFENLEIFEKFDLLSLI